MSTNHSISWPGWETVGLIGRGSFGAVYKIQRDLFGEIEIAALKVISIPQNAGDIDEMYSDGYDEESITSTFRSHLKSIVAEYSLMRKMNGSANIVNCDDIRYVQHDDGIGWDIFIKMELLTPLGKTLQTEIPEETVVRVAEDMCMALELCQKHGIVHRDIKPQNIFLSPNGDYKLGDFGIAKTVEKTMGGTKIGTYKYMAPEVYNNQPYGSSADIYSLGLVLYWMLNERRMPFLPLPPEKLRAGLEEESRQRRFSGERIPAPKHGSEELKNIILKACAYDPKDRYKSVNEMLDDLRKMSGGYVATPQPVTEHAVELENDKTVGPVFGYEQGNKGADALNNSEAENLGKTVDPVVPTKAETDETPAVKTGKSKKKIKFFILALVAACITVAVVLSQFLGRKDPQVNKNHTSLQNKVDSSSAVTKTNDKETRPQIAPTEKETLLFGLDMTLEEFKLMSDQLIEATGTWTQETAPQTLVEFPFIPSSFMEVIKTVKSAEGRIEVSGSTLIWKTDLPLLFPSSKTNMNHFPYFEYLDYDKNGMQHTDFVKTDNCEYTVQLPENVWEANNNHFSMIFCEHDYIKGWDARFEVKYPVSNKEMGPLEIIIVTVSNGEYSFGWTYWEHKDELSVHVFSFANGQLWQVFYDVASGRLTYIGA